jgi:glycerol-3-phosphate dehydrogenase
MDKDIYDICVIGGGVNGCGIARDAVGRGYKVLLLEKNDLASATSSASTKLIHGGLRYLESYEFSLVKKALRERDGLMNLAPHITWPMRFVLPHEPHQRPLWMIRMGLYLYDFLAGKTPLPKSSKVVINPKILKQNFQKGIEYSDCWVEDTRLVVLNAMDAGARGAVIKTNTACTSITQSNDQWNIETADGKTYHAQMVVNAGGPWAADIMDKQGDVKRQPLRLVKGSHLIVDKLYNSDECYILQNADGRIVFTIPYEGDYTLVGTTDIDMGDDPNQKIEISAEETEYLKTAIGHYFKKQIKDRDIIDSYAGVRPLADDDDGEAAYASRDYDFNMQHVNGLPFLTILGGKLTTYRVLSEQAVNKIDKQFHNTSAPWTADAKLPGGDITDNNFDRFVREKCMEYPFLSKGLLRRYARAYGTCMDIILNRATSLDDMGADLGGGVYGRELDYLIAYEFAKTGEDVLKRRSKLYLHLDKAAQKAVAKYMKDHA